RRCGGSQADDLSILSDESYAHSDRLSVGEGHSTVAACFCCLRIFRPRGLLLDRGMAAGTLSDAHARDSRRLYFQHSATDLGICAVVRRHLDCRSRRLRESSHDYRFILWPRAARGAVPARDKGNATTRSRHAVAASRTDPQNGVIKATPKRRVRHVPGSARVHRSGGEARCFTTHPDADPQFEIGGVPEVAAGLPECPALFIRTDQGVCTRLSDFHKRDDHTAAGGACARHRSEAATARCTQGVDEETADAHATHPYCNIVRSIS